MKKLLYILSFIWLSVVAMQQEGSQDGIYSCEEFIPKPLREEKWLDEWIEKKAFSQLTEEFKEQIIKDEIDVFYIKYKSDDGLDITGVIAQQKGLPHPLDQKDSDQKKPVIIFCRTGYSVWRPMSPPQLLAILPFVKKGYVVVGTNYRGAHQWPKIEQNKDGEQEAHNEYKDYKEQKFKLLDELGGKDVEDVLKLITIAKRLPYIDSNQFFMFGYGRGAMQACITLKRLQEKNCTGAILYAGIYDRKKFEEERFDEKNRPIIKMLHKAAIPEYIDDPEAALKSRSAVEWADQIGCPLLLIDIKKQARAGKAVDGKSQLQVLAAKLKEEKLSHETHTINMKCGLIYTAAQIRKINDEIKRVALDWLEQQKT